VGEKTLVLDATGTEWRAIVYETTIDGRQILALVRGEVKADEPVLCRMHAGVSIADVFASTKKDGGKNLREAITRIEAAGAGIVVYLPPKTTIREELESYGAPQESGGDQRLREFGLGAQVLGDLGARKLRLLTNNPRKIAGIRGYGLEVVSSEPLAVGKKS
jgi:3,4-dihydroxy 2-butanone 4-phosphate synthase/GTP cyclohydrolase II